MLCSMMDSQSWSQCLQEQITKLTKKTLASPSKNSARNNEKKKKTIVKRFALHANVIKKRLIFASSMLNIVRTFSLNAWFFPHAFMHIYNGNCIVFGHFSINSLSFTPQNCFSVFDHFAGLKFKGLRLRDATFEMRVQFSCFKLINPMFPSVCCAVTFLKTDPCRR